MELKECPHVDAIEEDVEAQAEDCQEYGRVAPVRMCMTCGYVGCCESFGSHDTDHFEATGHPIIQELPRTDDSFVWCYGCETYLS